MWTTLYFMSKKYVPVVTEDKKHVENVPKASALTVVSGPPLSSYYWIVLNAVSKTGPL
jgi:hypothetical protein